MVYSGSTAACLGAARRSDLLAIRAGGPGRCTCYDRLRVTVLTIPPNDRLTTGHRVGADTAPDDPPRGWASSRDRAGRECKLVRMTGFPRYRFMCRDPGIEGSILDRDRVSGPGLDRHSVAMPRGCPGRLRALRRCVRRAGHVRTRKPCATGCRILLRGRLNPAVSYPERSRGRDWYLHVTRNTPSLVSPPTGC
jgi:hypothetical protein